MKSQILNTAKEWYPAGAPNSCSNRVSFVNGAEWTYNQMIERLRFFLKKRTYNDLESLMIEQSTIERFLEDFKKELEQGVYVDGYIVDINPVVIKAYEELELIVGDQYQVNYGIHQGLYEYVGKTLANCKNPNDNELFKGCHLFRSCETGEITFGYHGVSSPFEFERIVRKVTK